MGVLAPGSAHARPSAQPPMTGKHVCRTTFKHGRQILRTRIQSLRNWSKRSACASAYEVAIKLGIISLSSPSPPPPLQSSSCRSPPGSDLRGSRQGKRQELPQVGWRQDCYRLWCLFYLEFYDFMNHLKRLLPPELTPEWPW